ncbi:hypothetical protein AB0C27_10025 [Nonomuraea sp. NPDC048882]|uniref:hypothetical protein n=1 Tax=Nonomuraea sp. NPDC048882 TaxID=3154347 RepID=UPI0033E70F61
MTHMITIPGETPCECGNALTQGQTRCAKCVARSRWARKERARNRRNRGSEIRRPRRGPRSAAAMGVSWT